MATAQTGVGVGGMTETQRSLVRGFMQSRRNRVSTKVIFSSLEGGLEGVETRDRPDKSVALQR